MSNWKDILDQLKKEGSTHDVLRRKYLKKLRNRTGRNVIAYYSGWLQNDLRDLAKTLSINDNDKNGFMTAIHNLDTSLGLDLILHTPGGDVAATESIIDYLKSKFDDIRVIVPQLAMSGGTMIACASNKILMGKQSSLGPIDPQFNGLPAHGFIEEFEQAHREIKADNSRIAVWQPIINKYSPTLVGECYKAVQWSRDIAKNCLEDRMLASDPRKTAKVDAIIKELCDHSVSLSHSRHLSAEKCRAMGLNIEMLEDDDALQNDVLTIHHIFMHTLTSTAAVKIIENHLGVAFIQQVQQTIMLKQ